MLLSLFIPTGNRPKSLKLLLNSLINQSYKNFEILIVGSKENTDIKKLIGNYKNILKIHYVHQKTSGLTEAANMALKQAKGNIFVRTDDDVVTSTTWLANINQTFQDKRVGGATGPAIIPKNFLNNRDVLVFIQKIHSMNGTWKLIGTIYLSLFLEGKPFKVDHWFRSGAFSFGASFKTCLKEPYQEVNNLEPCNYSVRTDLLKKIGGFDPIYKGVGEYHEGDAAFKIKRLGYKLVFNPKIVVFHHPSRSGVFSNRAESFSRMENFTIFYLRFLKTINPFDWVKFLLYVSFQWGYYLHSSLRTRKISYLGAIPGFFSGLLQYIRYR